MRGEVCTAGDKPLHADMEEGETQKTAGEMTIDKRLLEPEIRHFDKTPEQEDWERAGCTNNEEWHIYLNKQIWKDHTPDSKGKYIIGTAPERISWKHRHSDE